MISHPSETVAAQFKSSESDKQPCFKPPLAGVLHLLRFNPLPHNVRLYLFSTMQHAAGLGAGNTVR